MAAYEKALDWRELFAIGIQEGVMGEKLIEMARGVAGTWQHHSEIHVVPMILHDREPGFQKAACRGCPCVA